MAVFQWDMFEIGNYWETTIFRVFFETFLGFGKPSSTVTNNFIFSNTSLWTAPHHNSYSVTSWRKIVCFPCALIEIDAGATASFLLFRSVCGLESNSELKKKRCYFIWLKHKNIVFNIFYANLLTYKQDGTFTGRKQSGLVLGAKFKHCWSNTLCPLINWCSCCWDKLEWQTWDENSNLSSSRRIFFKNSNNTLNPFFLRKC